MHSSGVPCNSVNPLDISAFNSVDVVESLIKSYFIIHIHRKGPATTTGDKCHTFEIHVGNAGYIVISVKYA